MKILTWDPVRDSALNYRDQQSHCKYRLLAVKAGWAVNLEQAPLHLPLPTPSPPANSPIK